MSSRRRSKSREKKIPSKLRMDSKPPTPRITDPSVPAGRRKEIDNVMKKARAQTSPNSGAFWDKKLLEVEAKDPNRWRHSGYKSLYIDGSSPSRSRSRSASRSRSRSPPAPYSPRRRSPPSRFSRVHSPRSPPPRSRTVSPLPRGRRSPRSPPRRPRSPPSPAAPRRRSVSNSSISSCSDESCSVCSPKNRRGSARSRSRSLSPPMQYRLPARKPAPNSGPKVFPSPMKRPHARPPSPRSPPPQPRRMPTTPPPIRKSVSKSDRPTDPRRQPPPPRPRGSTGEVIDLRGVKPPPNPAMMKKGDKVGVQPMLLKRIKKERTGKRSGSPGAQESSGSEESTASSPVLTPIVATTSLTLSERFGKIAQWSADRERRDLENMRITKTGGSMKVMVEEELLYGSPPRRYSLSPVPSGHFPEKLMSSGQSRLASWDDVRVRYQYYKDLGYLRDLTLDDYIKWEEWWYKYQDWLANERHYERWLTSHGNGRRRGKKRPASQRLN